MNIQVIICKFLNESSLLHCHLPITHNSILAIFLFGVHGSLVSQFKEKQQLHENVLHFKKNSKFKGVWSLPHWSLIFMYSTFSCPNLVRVSYLISMLLFYLVHGRDKNTCFGRDKNTCLGNYSNFQQ